MAITETITDLPTPPSSSDAANFISRADSFIAGLDTFAVEMNTVIDQINATDISITEKEESASSSALIASSYANFKGVWTNQTTTIGETWLYNGNVYVVLVAGNTSPITSPSNWHSESLLSVRKDSSTGAAQLPVGTELQRPSVPSAGQLRFNSDVDKPEVYNGTSWGSVGGGATGGGSDEVFIENSYSITADYTIPAGKSAVSVGDASGNINIDSGVTISLDSNSRWVVL